MKVQAIASPNDIKIAPSPDLKARAIAAFNGSQATKGNEVVQNQNSIQPEELGAIIPKPNIQASQTPEIDTPADGEVATAATGEPSTEVVAPKPPTPQDEALSKQYAQLLRQQKQLKLHAQQQANEFKAKEAALKAREAEILEQGNKYKQGYVSIEQLKADPLSVLSQAEVSYDALTQQIINQQPVDPRMKATIEKLEAKIQQLEQANQDSQKSYQENQQAQYQAAVKQIKLDTQALVSQDPNFETIKATRSVQDVVDLITKTYEKDGVLLTVEEAATEVENYLVDEALKLTQVSKIRSRLQATQDRQPKAQNVQTQNPKQTQPMKTLTNATSSTRQLSAKERAILAFKGELK